LKPGGKLFHYVSKPGSKYRNKSVEKGVINRLRNVGFDVKFHEKVSGVVCVKHL